MRLSTAVKMGDLSSPQAFFRDFERILKTNLKAGFSVLDMAFAQYTRNPSPLRGPRWLDWLKNLNDVSRQVGVKWGQGHAHFFLKRQKEDDELVRRSMKGAGLLGVQWLVAHPLTVPEGTGYSRQKSLKANLEMWKQYGEWAAKYGVKLALENMSRGFASGPEELLELLHFLNDPLFGICWDTGHGHIAGLNQKEALLQLGPQLQALHIADNGGTEDEHLMPLWGTIRWQPIVQALRAINYQGDFTFEVIYRERGYPYRLYELYVETLITTGEYLLSLA